jgi:hypothetical protein
MGTKEELIIGCVEGFVRTDMLKEFYIEEGEKEAAFVFGVADKRLKTFTSYLSSMEGGWGNTFVSQFSTVLIFLIERCAR